MSGGPQHPFHTQSNQHNYVYPPFSSAPSQSPPPYGHNLQQPGAYPQQHHGNFFPASDAASYHGAAHNQQPTSSGQFESNQFTYPTASAASTGNLLAPDFDVNGAGFQGHSSASPYHLHQGHWNHPQAANSPFQSHSPQPVPQHAYANFPPASHEHFQHQQQHHHHQLPSFAPSAEHESIAQPLKQEAAELESISTPPLPPIDSTAFSPQKPAFRIKIKRTYKTQESSSGGQQAQAQLQIDPSAVTSSDMPARRPTRSAATAASANIHNSYSDSPGNRSLRARQVKQQPGSEEDYEEVSPKRQKTHDDVDDDDGEEMEGEEEDDHDEYDEQQQLEPEQPGRRLRERSRQPAAAQQIPKITLKNKDKGKDKGKQKAAPPRSNSSRASSSASANASANARAQPQSRRGSSKPELEPTRRSTRLSRDSQPPSFQDPSLLLPPPPSQKKTRSFEVMSEQQRRQLVSSCSGFGESGQLDICAKIGSGGGEATRQCRDRLPQRLRCLSGASMVVLVLSALPSRTDQVSSDRSS